METVAIAITTRNRPEVLSKSLDAWNMFLPENAKIIVVDDASIKQINSDYRFKTNVGIARAKNKCIELSKDFDHIFLVDDDVRPKIKDWHLPYITSGVNHLCLTFDTDIRGRRYNSSIRKEGSYNNLVSYTYPNGCFLYLKKICIEKAGGFRPEFGTWGFEHVEYSQRIHNIGLTPKPFLDVPNSTKLIEVLDYLNAVKSSVDQKTKTTSGQKNYNIYKKYLTSKDYVPFS